MARGLARARARARARAANLLFFVKQLFLMERNSECFTSDESR